MEKLCIVMPAYNEEANIEDVVRQWHPIAEQIVAEGGEAELIIANDGSKDSTFDKLQALAKKYQYLLPIDKSNSGHGATVLYLYRTAIDRNADFIFQTDSDGQTDPSEFTEMWESRNKYHFQIGHRDHREDGRSRIFVTKVLKGVVLLTFGVNITDANTPFRLMKAEAVAEIMKKIRDTRKCPWRGLTKQCHDSIHVELQVADSSELRSETFEL